MNLEEHSVVFAVGTLALILLAASPTLSLVLSFPSGKAKFTEFWVLGPNHMMEDYPFNVRVNETYRVFVGVGNHMGSSSYYAVYVKFRNQTQPLPDALNSTPSSLPPLYEYQVFVADEATWETVLTFKILGVSRVRNSTLVGDVSINDSVFFLNSTALWDSKYSGFYYQMFLELWVYNTTSQSFQYHNRFVAFWLHMTI